MSEQPPKPTYEDQVRSLEQLLSSLEGGNVPLHELVEKYEQASKLLVDCQKKLEAAEIRIRQIQIGPGGQPVQTTPSEKL